MDNNDLLRRLRYALRCDDAQTSRFIQLGGGSTTTAQAARLRAKETEPEFLACEGDVVAQFLDGLIFEYRGPRETPAPSPWPDRSKSQQASSAAVDEVDESHSPADNAAQMNNNTVLKQLRIALALRSDDVHAILKAGGSAMTASEAGALFRKPDARNYRQCGGPGVATVHCRAGEASRTRFTGLEVVSDLTGDTNLAIDDNVVVSMSYRLENGNGELLDTSQGQLPMVYMHNTNAILSSLERELTGKKKGDEVDVVIYPEEGYGYAKEELVQELPRERFEGIELSVGMRVKASNKQSDEMELLTVAQVNEDTVIVDANHPLAGQILHFKIVIVEVRNPTDIELTQGFAVHTNTPDT